MRGNILERIEEKYKVEEIRLNDNLRIWPILRQGIYFYDLKKRLGYSSKKRTRTPHLLIKNFFYGFKNIFQLRKFEFLFFENTNKRILVEDKFYDVYFDAWADKLGRSKSLFIEFASKTYYPKDKIHSKHIISDLPIKLISSFISLFIFPKINNLEILEKIQLENSIEIDLKKEIKKQLGEYYFYRLLFRLIKPKAVFVLSSFSKISLVMAAKSTEIKVFEAQHGYIGESHPFYNVKHKQFNESYPDILFSFGNYEMNNSTYFIFKKDQVKPIGGLELEFLKSKKVSRELRELRKTNKLIFCITLQGIMEKEIIGSTIPFAEKNPNHLFFLCPKNREFDYSSYLEFPNYRLSEYSIYEILKISDYNLTIFSTTAIEGESMGVKTIFYNADNLSKKYFNVTKLGAAVIEAGEYLSERHLTRNKKELEPYYVNGYFGNVENCKIDI